MRVLVRKFAWSARADSGIVTWGWSCGGSCSGGPPPGWGPGRCAPVAGWLTCSPSTACAIRLANWRWSNTGMPRLPEELLSIEKDRITGTHPEEPFFNTSEQKLLGQRRGSV